MKNDARLVSRLLSGVRPWSDLTAIESGEMILAGTVPDARPAPPAGTFRAPIGLRLSRAVHEDCRGSLALIRLCAARAHADGRPRRLRLVAAARCGRGRSRAVAVELRVTPRGGHVEVREAGEG